MSKFTKEDLEKIDQAIVIAKKHKAFDAAGFLINQHTLTSELPPTNYVRTAAQIVDVAAVMTLGYRVPVGSDAYSTVEKNLKRKPSLKDILEARDKIAKNIV